MTRHALDYFTNPASVAVIGASTVLHKAGGRRWRSMVEAGFAGPLYPIHPTASEILGHKAYRSLAEVTQSANSVHASGYSTAYIRELIAYR